MGTCKSEQSNKIIIKDKRVLYLCVRVSMKDNLIVKSIENGIKCIDYL